MQHSMYASVQNKVLIMLGLLADQNQFWLDNFTFYSATILLFKISAHCIRFYGTDVFAEVVFLRLHSLSPELVEQIA